MMRHICLISLFVIGLLAWPRGAGAAEVIPSSPTPQYIVDDAHVLHAATLQAIDQQLQQFERDTSNQIVVAIYPKMQSDDDIAAYGVRVFQAWHIGQKGKDNGALLLVFINDRKLNITTGYGLEGALPDATCKTIIEHEIKPALKRGDFDAGIQAGVNAIMAATKGEYKGTGQTGTGLQNYLPSCFTLFFFGLLGMIIISGIIKQIFGTAYASSGRTPGWVIPFIIFSNALSSRSRGGRGGWGGGGGGGWSSGGGGFSGGGGSTGGGGASGSW